MNQGKEFQIEYSILLPIVRYGSFETYGNPFDREELLLKIATHAGMETPAQWSQTLGIRYKVTESARLLDSSWDSVHQAEATAAEMIELLEHTGKSSKMDKMREMHNKGED